MLLDAASAASTTSDASTITLDRVALVATAGATLILAWFTYRLARATVRLVEESTRARLDGLAPQVAVRYFGVLVEPLHRSAAGTFSPVEPGSPTWSLKQHGDIAIGVQAEIGLVNEGSRTARLTITSGPDVDLQSAFSAGHGPLIKQGPSYVLPPGAEAQLTVIRWRALREWVADWESAHGQAAGADGWVTVQAVSSATTAVLDTVHLTFGAFPFVPHPTSDSWVPASSSLSGVPPTPVTAIGEWKREYP